MSYIDINYVNYMRNSMKNLILSIVVILSTLITPISAYELDDIPEYNGTPYVEIHDNEPQFNSSDMNKKSLNRIQIWIL